MHFVNFFFSFDFLLCSVSKLGFSSSYEYSSPRRRSTELGMWNRNNNAEPEETDDDKSNKFSNWFASNNKKESTAASAKSNSEDEDSVRYKIVSKYENVKEEVSQKMEEVSQKVLSVLPAPLVEFLAMVFAKIKAALPSLKIAALSFSTGAVLMLAAILVPVYSSVENLSQPVTLFETILADLDAGYVDEVDTNKLFETGVSAMLKSLDPYTEFEAKEDAYCHMGSFKNNNNILKVANE